MIECREVGVFVVDLAASKRRTVSGLPWLLGCGRRTRVLSRGYNSDFLYHTSTLSDEVMFYIFMIHEAEVAACNGLQQSALSQCPRL